MVQQDIRVLWRAAWVAARIGSEGAFTLPEEEFVGLCREQIRRVDLAMVESSPSPAEQDQEKAARTLQEITKQLLRFFIELSREPEQEARFNELLAELSKCRTLDDFEEFKISLNIFLNFFQKTLQDMAEDRNSLQTFLKDLAVSIHTLHKMGKNFLQILEDFQRDLGTIDDTQRMEVMLNFLVTHCATIKTQSESMYERLFEINHQIFRLQEKLEQIRVKDPAAQPGQLLESKAFREKFRYLLQGTRFQRDSVSLILFKLGEFNQLEKDLGGEMLTRIIKHLVSAFTRHLGKNDMICRLDRDILALLFLNATDTDARRLGKSLLATARAMKFRCRGQAFRVKGCLAIASCRMYDTMETVIRKALLELEIGQTGEDLVMVTENEIPPDLMETVYTL